MQDGSWNKTKIYESFCYVSPEYVINLKTVVMEELVYESRNKPCLYFI